MTTSRLERKKTNCESSLNKENQNDMFAFFINAAKRTARISDEEFEYLKKNISEEEKKIILQGKLSFNGKRQFLSIIESHLKNYQNNL